MKARMIIPALTVAAALSILPGCNHEGKSASTQFSALPQAEGSVETPPLRESGNESGAQQLQEPPGVALAPQESDTPAPLLVPAAPPPQDSGAPVAPAPQPQAVASPSNTFAIDLSQVFTMYIFEPSTVSYYSLGVSGPHLGPADFPLLHSVGAVINNLPELPSGEIPAGARMEAGLMLVHEADNYRKTIYSLYPGTLVVDDRAYALTDEQHSALKKAMTPTYYHSGPYAQWLIFMNPNRVVNVEVTDEHGVFWAVHDANLFSAAVVPRYLNVSGGRTAATEPTPLPPNSDFVVVFTFDNGVRYTMVFTGNEMYLESSDVGFACRYQIDNAEFLVRAFRSLIAEPVELEGPDVPLTGKPVIYLYPQETKNITVRLDFDGVLTYTFPAYRGSWNVTASPDGKIINLADNSIHYYLFWEGVPNFNDWDFSEGFVVRGWEVERFLLEKLPLLGLTPREYNDFISYWAPQMINNEYNLVTFATTQYEKLAKLTVSPAPDTAIIVHMVWKPIRAPVAVREQTLPRTPERNGFTLVEWGGTRAT